jgi:DNA mismatch repair protein MLH3
MTQADRASKMSNHIQPLPPEVVAQIRSSAAITSLNDVVRDLLCNALDAQSTKIEIEVDFGRGSCIIQDDGHGIQPLEFEPDGGLGVIYCRFDSMALRVFEIRH